MKAVHRAPSDYPSGKAAEVLTAEFTADGVPCLGLNGGRTSIKRKFLPSRSPPTASRDRPLLERHRWKLRPRELLRLM